MKISKTVIVVVSIIIGLVLLVKLVTIAFVEPWLEKKIETALHEKYTDYKIEIDQVNILFFSMGVELETILIRSRTDLTNEVALRGEIESIKFRRINLYKLISDNDIEIREIKITGGTVKGEIPEQKEKKAPAVSNMNIRIGRIIFNNVAMSVKHASSSQTYLVKGGVLNIQDLEVKKADTISTDLIKAFDFKAEEFISVVDDSMYTIKAGGIVYAANSKNLTVKDLIVHPNYPDYVFTSKKRYQTDCIKAIIQNISFQNFSVVNYLKYKNLTVSYIEVKEMDLHVFRDRRKEFHHTKKPMFQELIYNFNGRMKVDSVGLINGNVTYTEHVDMAVQPGKVNFHKINAKVYNITNDTIYKVKEGYFEIKGQALFMGKGKMTVHLKSRIYDPHYAFSLSGGLSVMQASAVNPMLEKNAFIYVTSGKVSSLHFNLWADQYKATGKMIMLYDGLDIAVKSKKTNDTTHIKEKVISLIANTRIMDSNPLPGEEVREGKIDYERDPEKFLFNYCFKSILSGMKASLSKAPKEKRHKRKE